MKIQIHRGQNQIGGSIIEIASESTRLVFDIGVKLDEGEAVAVPQIQGLFTGNRDCDAAFNSHYYADHVGLAAHPAARDPGLYGREGLPDVLCLC